MPTASEIGRIRSNSPGEAITPRVMKPPQKDARTRGRFAESFKTVPPIKQIKMIIVRSVSDYNSQPTPINGN